MSVSCIGDVGVSGWAWWDVWSWHNVQILSGSTLSERGRVSKSWSWLLLSGSLTELSQKSRPVMHTGLQKSIVHALCPRGAPTEAYREWMCVSPQLIYKLKYTVKLTMYQQLQQFHNKAVVLNCKPNWVIRI